MSDPVRMPNTKGHLRQLEQMVRGEIPPPHVAPIAKLVGFTIVQIELGRSVFEMQAGPQHANPMGTLHGGIVCDPPTARWGPRWRRLSKTTSRSRPST